LAALAGALAITALLAGCGTGGSKVPEILGEVNNEYLTTDEFMHQFKARGGAALQGPARAEFKRWLLAELVDRKLLLQEARRRGLRPSREDVRGRILEMGSRGWEEAERAQVLNVEDDLYEQRQIEDLMRHELPPVGTPSLREVRRYIQAHADLFTRPAQVRLRQIVVHSAAMVEDAQRMIKAGESFEGVVRRLGGTPAATVLGPAWNAADDVPDEVWAAAASAPKGEVRGPVASEYGFHLFKVEGRRDAGPISRDEAEARASRLIVGERRHAGVQAFLVRLRRSAVIRVDRRAVASL
jgi:parvulin-like peptidyl-prolyl isomerase